MIDFDATVIAAGQDAFARPIVVTPLRSMPAPHTPYPARGVWSSRDVDIPLEDGGILSGQRPTLSIRVSEFVAQPPPGQGDLIAIPAYMTTPDLGSFIIEDGDDDGQGATLLTLKEYQT